ncbi:DNA-directed RNA polymerase III subunit RPC5 [Nymphon striatum]|nr:DNA-directed RNA polymerase III subunit RPC5 [Nymphon striatum]
MDVYSFKSTQALRKVQNCAIGAIKDGALHLTSLAGVLQTRPDCSYLDKCDVQSQKIGSYSEEKCDGDEIEAKQVKVKYARRETDKAKRIRESSFAFHVKNLLEEPWIPLNIHLPNSQYCSKELSKLICDSTDSDARNYWSENLVDYSKLLFLSSCEIVRSPSTSSEKNTNMNVKYSKLQLKNLSICDHIKIILINSFVIKMSQLIKNVPREHEIKEVLKILQQVAWLVQGCWVVRSEVLYEEIEVSKNGTPHDLLCRGRDFILPQDDIKDILLQMSELSSNKNWQFKLSYDAEFVEKYPDVVTQQKLKWDMIHKNLSKYYALSPRKDQTKGKSAAPRQRRRTKSGHSTSGDESSGTDACKKQLVKQSLPEPISPIKNNKHFHNNENSINQCDMSTVRFVPSSKTKTELLNFIQSELEDHRYFTVPMLRKLLDHMLAESSPGNVLSTGVSDMLLQQSLIECGGDKRQFKWLPVDEPVFFFWKLNEPGDKIRRAIVDLFEDSDKLRFHISKKKIEEINGSAISEKEFRNFLKDYASPKTGFYYFRMSES